MLKKNKRTISAFVLMVGLLGLIALALLGKSIISSYSKNKLLKSSNIDEVTKGIALNYVPFNELKIQTDYKQYDLDFFFVEFSNTQYEKFNKTLFNAVPHNSTADEITFNNDEWNTFIYSEVSDILTKGGYGCVRTSPGALYQSGGNNPGSLYCANILNLKNNTMKNVEEFMLNTLIEAGVNCQNTNCKIKQIRSSFPIPMYARKVGYLDKKIKLTEQEIAKRIKSEAERSASELMAAGYSVQNMDNTEADRNGGFGNTVVSRLIRAENEQLSCTHRISFISSREFVKTYDFGKVNEIECAYTLKGIEDIQNSSR